MSVVIPTRDRPASLARLLASLASQAVVPSEVLVIDASKAPIGQAVLASFFPSSACSVIRSAPHVCRQRNLGVSIAREPFILLCDDDVELPPHYITALRTALDHYPECSAASGLITEPRTDGTFNDGWQSIRSSSLLWSFLFQLGLWTDLKKMKFGFPLATVLSPLIRYYERKGNSLSVAGWPLLTQGGEQYFRTEVYALGASLVHRAALLESTFDETLDPHGIGDNYGVCLGFRRAFPVIVDATLRVRHHRAAGNRLAPGETYMRRVFALHYFLKKDPRFKPINRIFLIWSLAGHYLAMLLRGERELRASTGKALRGLLFRGRNPSGHGRS